MPMYLHNLVGTTEGCRCCLEERGVVVGVVVVVPAAAAELLLWRQLPFQRAPFLSFPSPVQSWTANKGSIQHWDHSL